MKIVVWQHGEAYAIRTKDWSKRQYGFATRDEARAFARENWGI